jgi:hypothetical protein
MKSACMERILVESSFGFNRYRAGCHLVPLAEFNRGASAGVSLGRFADCNQRKLDQQALRENRAPLPRSCMAAPEFMRLRVVTTKHPLKRLRRWFDLSGLSRYATGELFLPQLAS